MSVPPGEPDDEHYPYNSGNEKCFCDCVTVDEGMRTLYLHDDDEPGQSCLCNCGEVAHTPAWGWSTTDKSPTAAVYTCKNSGRQQLFTLNVNTKTTEDYSSGNSCVRGETPFVNGYQYFWEIKVVSQIFGTSVMIGIGTENVLLDKYMHSFCDFLGDDEESWGLIYSGHLRHNNKTLTYHSNAGFSQGSIIGLHLDMWNGTLEYFLNRESLGIAFRGLRNKTLYPMVSATASHICMKLIYSVIIPHSLHYQLLKSVTEKSTDSLPHGLKAEAMRCWWHFPKFSPPGGKRADPPEVAKPIYIMIDVRDSSTDAEHFNLVQRMKRVLENSSYRRSRICVKRFRSDTF